MQRVKRSTITAAAALAAACILSGNVPALGASVETESMAGQTAEAEKEVSGSGSFDDAIDALYGLSGSITDEEILERSRGITSDGSKLYSELGAAAAKEAAEALSAYEEYKAEYLRSRINKEEENIQQEPAVQAFAAVEETEADRAVREWDLQGEYTQMLIGEDSCIRELVPRYKVTSCVCKEDILELGIEEWMTQGYGSPEEGSPLNVSAYSYTFSLSLRRDEKNAGWIPFAINGTESNFTWLREEEDPESVTQEAPQTLYAVQSDLGTQILAYAQIGTDTAGADDAASVRDGVQDEEGQNSALSFIINRNAAVLPISAEDTDAAADADLTAVGTNAYTYTASKAVAYADKYWKNYNRSYKEYRGVDCANFVSQCLYAGGMPKTTDWYPQSVNWINVMGHIRHFKSYGTFVTATNASVRTGNPVYYDWNGDGTYDHTAICVGTNASGLPVVDGHTSNVYHVAWSMGSRGKRGTIILNPSRAAPAPVQKNMWKTISGKVYYVGGDGKIVKSTFLTIGGARYYFNSSGVRVTGSFKVGGRWYYANPSNGAMARGWKKLKNKWYYYSPSDYARVKGGKRVINGATYCFSSKGYMKTGFIKINKKYYYADKKSGKFVTGWKKISGKWYYFNPKTMVRVTGWKTIKGRKYYFNSKGVLKKEKRG